MPQFLEPSQQSFDPVDPPWLEDHFSQFGQDHECDECGIWTAGQEAVLPKSGRGNELKVKPYNSFTALGGLWCTPDFFRSHGYFDKEGEGITESMVAYAIAYASDILYRLSGRQYPGLVERVVYPGASQPLPILSVAYLDTEYQRDTYDERFAPVAFCGDVCSLKAPQVVRLPGPISNIIEIVIDGEVVDPSTYRIRSHKEVIRLDGNWPLYNDLTRSPYALPPGRNVVTANSDSATCNCSQNWVQKWANDAEFDLSDASLCSSCGKTVTKEIDPAAAYTHKWEQDPFYNDVVASLSKQGNQCSAWAIRYYQGKCPPISGQLAAAALAKQVIEWMQSDGCFPKNMRRLSADGIDARFSDRFQAINGKDMLGIPEVDVFLMSVNPFSLSRRGYVRRGDQRHRKIATLRSQVPDVGVKEPEVPIVQVAARRDFTIYQGDSFTLALTYKTGPANNPQPTALDDSVVIKGQIKESLNSTTVIAQFDCYLDNQVTNPGRIVVDLSPDESEKLIKPGYVYDVEVNFAPDQRQTLLHGRLHVINDVTE